MAIELHVLSVFPGPGDAGGNPLGVVLDGRAVPAADRQATAARLGFSETVFVDDLHTGEIRIFTPASELPFAGHPTVGTAWLLASRGTPAKALRPPAGEVLTWEADGLTWVRGRAEWAPEMELRQYPTAAEVDALTGAPEGIPFHYAWSWVDDEAGEVRSRAFAPGVGIAEDEATGAAAIRLTAALGRPLRIRQGTGSLLVTCPGPDGTVDLGGRTVLTEVRPL